MDQTSLPAKGETIAVMHTNMGDIKLKFFPDYAPKAVENFITHAKNGYYNGIIFHRILNDFMIQGGDPTSTGCGGESIWKSNFEDEFSDELFNLRGALSMANAGPGTNGSQFFIVQKGPSSKNELDFYESRGIPMTEKSKKLYETVGGTPWLDGHHTVFGFVYEGMDTVDKIANVRVDQNGRSIDEDIVINTIDIDEF